MSLRSFFHCRRVLVTGHTGFKGAWLCEWLVAMGAEVFGVALDPPTSPSLYVDLGLAKRIARDTRLDVRDGPATAAAIETARPSVILHLAAQPLVRASYAEPVTTFATNVMGTVHVLEAARALREPCAVVCVTTDKCYENREWLAAYRETDRLGGHDPYSASKAAAELAIASYERSFGGGSAARVVSARAGNVIGGGDWAEDRIVPDAVRAWSRAEPLRVRNPHATRPWQHVLEPLAGYLTLAHAALAGDARARSGAFNFGPTLASNRSVGALVSRLLEDLGGAWVSEADPTAPHEASRLNLAVDKAYHVLGWRPVWELERAIAETASWYRAHAAGAPLRERTLAQIEAYEANAAAAGLPWAAAAPVTA